MVPLCKLDKVPTLSAWSLIGPQLEEWRVGWISAPIQPVSKAPLGRTWSTLEHIRAPSLCSSKRSALDAQAQCFQVPPDLMPTYLARCPSTPAPIAGPCRPPAKLYSSLTLLILSPSWTPSSSSSYLSDPRISPSQWALLPQSEASMWLPNWHPRILLPMGHCEGVPAPNLC